jgi:integrase
MRAYQQALAPVVAEIGQVRIDRLTPAILSHCFLTLHKRGLGGRRRQLTHSYLRQCLAHAVAPGGLMGHNPMDRVERPRWEPRTRRYWTVQEASRAITTAGESRAKWDPLFVLLATAGLRISEAIALRWSDVDLGGPTITIERAIVWSGNQRAENGPKTRAGARTITLPSVAVEALRRIPRPLDADQPIFVTQDGNPPNPAHLREPFARLCAKAGVPRINIHGLRHTAAAMAYRATGDPYAVQHRLGHANVSVTVGIYGYGTRADREVADRLGELLGGADRAETGTAPE